MFILFNSFTIIADYLLNSKLYGKMSPCKEGDPMRKKYIVLLGLCLLLVLCVGCGRDEPSAVDSVKIFYDLHIIRDTSEAERLGMTEEDIAAALAAYDEALAETIRSDLHASGLEIDDESVAAICEARISALSRMNAEYELTSENNDIAVVTLSTTYFDEASLVEEAGEAARKEADARKFTEYKEYQACILDAYIRNLIAGYEAVTPSEDRREVVVTCIIVDNAWIPEDLATLGHSLRLAVTGQ